MPKNIYNEAQSHVVSSSTSHGVSGYKKEQESQKVFDMKMRDWRLYELLIVATTILTTTNLAASLSGEHVCHRVENYTVTKREQYVEPVEIQTLAWCLQIPPRCPQTRTELRERWRTKTEVKYKSVPVCCEGYTMQELAGHGSFDAKCVPYCKKCRNGVCTAPNECTCDPGFQGQDCVYECPQGTWGQSCENECSCLREVACNPINGKCDCPAGWMGSRCENKCPEGQWGAGCNSICLCENPKARCHHETGECSESLDDNNNLVPLDPFEASGVSINLVSANVNAAAAAAAGAATVKSANTDYVDIIDFDKEAVLPRVTEHDSETAAVPSLPDEMIPVMQSGNNNGGDIVSSTTEGLSTKTFEERAPIVVTSPLPPPLRPTPIEGNQLSQSDNTNNNDQLKKNSGLFDFDERQTNFRVIVSPKTDYVKTTHKGGAGSSMSAIPIDVAAMIVVGAIVSIGLTSIAALMIFHVRSRLLKAALTIYNQEKAERQFMDKDVVSVGPGKGLDVTIGTLPRTMTRVNPVYNATSDSSSAVLTFDEGPAEYANGTVTIGIRLSSNLRDLLESHYDRPASCSHRTGTAPLATGEIDVEHVYDEIPLTTAPFYFGKNT